MRLAQDGIDVAVNDLRGTSLDAVAKEIAGMGRRTCAVYADVSEDDDARRMISEVAEKLGGLDIVRAVFFFLIDEGYVSRTLTGGGSSSPTPASSASAPCSTSTSAISTRR